MWKGYDKSSNNWIDEKDIILLAELFSRTTEPYRQRENKS